LAHKELEHLSVHNVILNSRYGHYILAANLMINVFNKKNLPQQFPFSNESLSYVSEKPLKLNYIHSHVLSYY
jgi:hypothetical protein